MQNRAILAAGAILVVVAGGMALATADNHRAVAAAAASSGQPPAAQSSAAPPSTPAPKTTSAQTAASGPPRPTAAPAQPAAPPSAKLSQAQLGQLLAPVALYPDQLLDQVLMASTYPLEVVEAARWVKEPAHQRLKGDALMAALKQQHWDPSVMALVPFPRVLDVMSERLQWTEALGNAFLAQQADVLAAVQSLRHDAMQAGNLDLAKCHCHVATNAGAISIAPANPGEVYVPVCNPQVAYGPWPYPAYPPYLLPLPVGYVWGPAPFIGFYPFVTVAWYGPLWGWAAFDWWDADIIVAPAAGFVVALGDPAFHSGYWVHDPAHRDGVPYASAAVAQRFGGRAALAGEENARFATTAHGAAAAMAAHGAAASLATHGTATARTGAVHSAATAHGVAAAHGALRSAAVAHAGFRGAAVAHGGFRGAAATHRGFHGASIAHGGFRGAAAAHGGGFHAAAAPHGGGAPHAGGHPGHGHG